MCGLQGLRWPCQWMQSTRNKMLKLTKLLEKNVGVTNEEVFIGQRIQLDGDFGEIDWMLISIYQTIIGFHTLLGEIK